MAERKPLSRVASRRMQLGKVTDMLALADTEVEVTASKLGDDGPHDRNFHGPLTSKLV